MSPGYEMSPGLTVAAAKQRWLVPRRNPHGATNIQIVKQNSECGNTASTHSYTQTAAKWRSTTASGGQCLSWNSQTLTIPSERRHRVAEARVHTPSNSARTHFSAGQRLQL